MIIVDWTNGIPEEMTLGVFLINIFNQNKVKKAGLVPRDIHLLLDAFNDGHRLDAQLDIIFTGGSPVHNATMEALGKITKKVIIGYGGTEFVSAASNMISKKSDFQDMCVGRLEDKYEVRIVGDDEEELPVGEQGQILIRSEMIFKGYLHDSTKTAEAFTKDGWYRTEDMGYFNKDGQLFVLGRKSDVIIKDGFNHYPGWMEQLIGKHPSVERCLVIGIPDPVHHEEICLCLKLVPGAEVSVDEMREYCKMLFITDENDKMTPLPKNYLIFDEFICSDNGKVERKKMKAKIIKQLEMNQ